MLFRNQIWNLEKFSRRLWMYVRPPVTGCCLHIISLLAFFFFFNVYLFILRERPHERERGGERERVPSRLRAINEEPDVGLKPTNHEIVT